jgi:Na+:H+ antiporter, NhaA family
MIRKLVHHDEMFALTQVERISAHILHPFQEFARRQASGSLLLLLCVIVALIWANSSWAIAYQQMLHEPFGISFGKHLLRFDLHHWINDGLMTVFFFIIGLELKRELLVGELTKPQHRMLPIAAAIGGMVVPALIYAAFNTDGEGAHGWGIPMATDAAFALGALMLFGARILDGLKVFLLALAIVDDLGALLVIAVFYTASIDWSGIVLASLFLIGLFMANRAGAQRGSLYLLLGVGVWYGLLISGVHATLAGILTALFVPTRMRIKPESLAHVIRRSADAIETYTANGRHRVMDAGRFAAISVLSRTLDSANSPVQRFEYIVQPWVTLAILPVFALFNSGVVIDASAMHSFSSPVTFGIIAGLVIGKPLGICLASWLAVKSGLATLPVGVSWSLVIGTAFLAGIGFTIALFISSLAFFPGTGLETQAKMGILVGSLVSAMIGIAILLITQRHVKGDLSVNVPL